ncbi:MAG: 3-isopropylmalate dehydratase large subunit [Deltaproteobacteria bacterium]|nr:3-isopropylmalate dehydratase large subunit [Candidatus Anaeroferrophillus wilburensis]MBN2888075.1 3-isopropylmalate dehydratase large subunit [Deltaproteobacteria bacterium]
MAMTITEKILASHAGYDEVSPGQLIEARVDIALANDVTAPIAIAEFEKLGIEKVFDPQRVVLVPDHFTPNKDIKSAEQAKIVRDFSRRQGLTNYFELGRMGIEHVLLPEQGIVLPGDLVIGADSHTCTYGALGAFATGMGSTDIAAAMATGKAWFKVPESIKFIYYGTPGPWVEGKDFILYTIGRIGVDGALYQAMEMAGDAIAGLPMYGRFSMANMAIEAGAKNGIIIPDDATLDYVRGRSQRDYHLYTSDPQADYAYVMEIDVAQIRPQVAFPSLPENSRDVAEAVEQQIVIDQVVIGSCTNGRIEDLRLAARVLKGNKVAPYLRLIVIPGTQEVYLQAVREGLAELFVEAGAVFSTPTCGPCLGGHMGILAAGERAVATTNRNFVGRMGHPDSEVYLSNPAVAAATAVMGRIASPEEVVTGN